MCRGKWAGLSIGRSEVTWVQHLRYILKQWNNFTKRNYNTVDRRPNNGSTCLRLGLKHFFSTDLLSLLSHCLRLSSSTSCIEVKCPEDKKKDYNNYYYSARKKIIEVKKTALIRWGHFRQSLYTLAVFKIVFSPLRYIISNIIIIISIYQTSE